MDECDVLAGRRAEDQLAPLRGRSEERAPTGAQFRPQRRVRQMVGDPVGERRSRDRAIRERVADAADQRFHLLLGHPDVAQPDVLAPALAGRGRDDEVGQIVRDEVMERAAEGPRLDDRSVVGERVADVVGPEAVDPGGRLELRGARDLGVQPTISRTTSTRQSAVVRRARCWRSRRSASTRDQSVVNAGGVDGFGMDR